MRVEATAGGLVMQQQATSPTAAASADADRYDFSDDLVSADLVRPDGELLNRVGRTVKQSSSMLAANVGPATDPAPAPDEEARPVALSDGRAGPLLIYTAQLQMAVYKVEDTQRQAIDVARELGGFFSEHADQVRLVLRVPAERFHDAIARLEAFGDVVHRHVRADDVTDQYRDLEIRLRNAEAMRERLIALLAKATDVTQSLQVEQQLDRVSERIERLKGELKRMADRIAYSTITIVFQIKREESIDPEFQLPFEWLRRLGLQHLLTLS